MTTTPAPATANATHTLHINGHPLTVDMHTAESAAGTLIGFTPWPTDADNARITVIFSGWREGRDVLGLYPVIVTEKGTLLFCDPMKRADLLTTDGK